MKTNKKSLFAQHEDISALIADGVTNKNKFYDGLKALMEFKAGIAALNDAVRSCKKDAERMSDMLSQYAINHKSVFDGEDVDGKFNELRDGVFNGNVPCEGEMYRFTVSRGDPVRIDGSNLTQPFLANLPEEWVKSKLELQKSKVAEVKDDKLAEHGLECKPKYTWTHLEA